jgi:uncharacterized membrane protein
VPRASGRGGNTILATLCYLPFFGWILSLAVLAMPRYRQHRTLRFHAFQGLFVFLAWMILDFTGSLVWGVQDGPARYQMARWLKLPWLAVAFYMMFKTADGQLIRLPVLSDFADRAMEQQARGR